MKKLFIIFIVCVYGFCIFHEVFGQPHSHLSGPKLVVIMFSGFRWDFLNYTNNGFKLMQDEGVKARSMQPVFPSLSYPNAYSLMTGKSNLYLSFFISISMHLI